MDPATRSTRAYLRAGAIPLVLLLVAAVVSSVAVLPASAHAVGAGELGVSAQAPIVGADTSEAGPADEESVAAPRGAEPRRAPAPVPSGGDVGPVGTVPLIPATTGICPPDALVKGVTTEEGERTFYTEKNQVYEAIVPEKCFSNPGAAASAGYRPDSR